MNAEDQNQDFERLQQLLKLKRYELPPPRFFNEFSGEVTARLRAGQGRGAEHIGTATSQPHWLRAFWRGIEARPAISGMLATSFCGLVMAFSFLGGKPVAPGLVGSAPQAAPAATTQASLLAGGAMPAETGTFTTTNPAAGVLPGSLFKLSPNEINPNFQPVLTGGRPIGQ